jgi:hypothetical protein
MMCGISSASGGVTRFGLVAWALWTSTMMMGVPASTKWTFGTGYATEEACRSSAVETLRLMENELQRLKREGRVAFWLQKGSTIEIMPSDLLPENWSRRIESPVG